MIASETPCEVERRTLKMLLRDIRNRQWLCGLFHHGQVEQRILKFDRSELDECVEEFAAEFGMIWSLDRDYGPRGDSDVDEG